MKVYTINFNKKFLPVNILSTKQMLTELINHYIHKPWDIVYLIFGMLLLLKPYLLIMLILFQVLNKQFYFI